MDRGCRAGQMVRAHQLVGIHPPDAEGNDHLVEGLSFRELSEALGVPLQTAATRVRRALALVRKQLAGSGIEVDP